MGDKGMKRYRKPVVKEGELHIYWGREDRHSSPDVIYHNGPGTSRGDSRLLHNALGCETQHLNLDAPLGSPRLNWVKYEPSLFKELEDRGYDLTTLRFYVKKKVGTNG